jgi:hypothetical protein
MNAPTNSSSLVHWLRSWAHNRIAMLDRNEGGAVALACLAACVVLFMTGLLLFDAGHAARAKVEAQNAADVSAYSQAAVKARTMNMIAYTNVAKRTIITLHNIYFGMWTAWVEWTAGRCKKAKKCKCVFCPTACWDCFINGALFIAEMFTDTIKYFGSAGSRHKSELEALTKYQKYMDKLTPWWAWSEGSVRGARNGAAVTSSFPPLPSTLLTSVPDWIEKALGFFGYAPLYNQTTLKDKMPIKKASWYDMCGVPFLSSGATLPWGAEFAANVLIHRQRSKEGAKKASVVAKGAAYALTAGCVYSWARFGGDNMAPYEPTAKTNSAKDLMAKSNIVFSYKMAPETRGHLRKNYDILPGADKSSIINPTTLGSGFWTLSRGEFYFDGGTPKPFEPKWTAKIRPVQLPGEFNQHGGNLNTNAMYHDIAPFLALSTIAFLGQNAIGGGGGGFGGGLQAAWGDLVFMEKASRTMDNQVINGLNK